MKRTVALAILAALLLTLCACGKVKQAEEAINYSIRSTVEGTASLQEEYRAACERQRQIDRRKAAGEKIPAGWIRNPFYRKFYRDRGMLADH